LAPLDLVYHPLAQLVVFHRYTLFLLRIAYGK